MSACHNVAILNTNQFVTLHQNITELILQSTRRTRNIPKAFVHRSKANFMLCMLCYALSLIFCLGFRFLSIFVTGSEGKYFKGYL